MTRKKRLIARKEYWRSLRQALKSGVVKSFYGFRFIRTKEPKPKRIPPEITRIFPKLKKK